jgi:hypothetical protein
MRDWTEKEKDRACILTAASGDLSGKDTLVRNGPLGEPRNRGNAWQRIQLG